MTDVVAAPMADRLFTSDSTERPFPELLRSHRIRAGLTQRALADLATISPRAIRDLESGRANARTQTITLLADGLRLQGLMRELFVHAGLNGRRLGRDTVDYGPVVPKPVNALLGRDTEVGAMVDVLGSGRRRMISISGLPGVGKTRVAAEIAARLNSRRGWPVLWIGAQARAPGGPGDALDPLLRSLRALIESSAEDISQVCHLVGRHEVLLVLDGVADRKVPVGVEELLTYCPGIRVINTSRAPWFIPGVHSTVIPPLPTPGPDTGLSLDSLLGVASVRLLVERLAEVRPGFALNPANAAAAAEICRRLDGLPLALEVVAGRTRVLSLQQLVELPVVELLDLAVPARPGGPPETIDGLIGSSYRRLIPEHRRTLRRLTTLLTEAPGPPAESGRRDRVWTVPEVATALGQPLDRLVDELSVLIGLGLVRATYGEPAPTLQVPNLMRAFLERQRKSGDGRPTRASRGVATHIRGVVSRPTATHPRRIPDSSDRERWGMTYNAADALREAGLLGGPMAPELEEFYASLTKQEADVLISTKNRLAAILPDVEAHSQEWSRPSATQEGFEAAMLCACSIWSGAGQV